MRLPIFMWGRLAGLVGLLWIGSGLLAGCGGAGGTGWEFLGSPYTYVAPTGGQTGPGSTSQTTGGTLGQSDRTPVNPCQEAQARKFVTLSMRNQTPDFVHYFFVAIAFVDVDQSVEGAVIPFFGDTQFPDGAVCAQDVATYRQFGYSEVASGTTTTFGDYCVRGPALIYFHRNGQFRRAAGTANTSLGSAIAPAQGSSPTYDNFFASAGVQVPVPDLIVFHNPGTGEGAALKISRQSTDPCNTVAPAGAPVCQRDAFYYVDDRGIMAGTTALGVGAGRRVPSEIQGTGCECTGLTRAFQTLAPSRVTVRGAQCNEFLRGGRIEFVFLRQDENPPVPQLLWKVTDSTGATVHEFDPRVTLP